jgi:hypothetical protein
MSKNAGIAEKKVGHEFSMAIRRPPPKALVSQAINIEAKPRGEAIRYAVGLIDAVHSDGKLPKIFASTDETLTDHGYYERQPDDSPWQIVLSPTGRHPELTCLHEIGHFLDHQALGRAGQWGSVSSRSLSGWRQAVEQTQAVQDLRSRKQGPLPVTLASGVSLQVFVEQRVLDYALRPAELFARSYAQYIARASQDKVLLVQIAGELDTLEWQVYPLQWQDKDFTRIYDQLELLLKQKGWRP